MKKVTNLSESIMENLKEDNTTNTGNKDKVKEILNSVRNEFEAETDDIENIFHKKISDETLDFAFEFLDSFISKVEMVMDDDLD